MKTFSISYMATRNDNGACVTFTSREAAETVRRELIADGCFHVSGVW